MIQLVIWSATAVLGVIPTLLALWQSSRDWTRIDMALDAGPHLRELVKEELFREGIILAGQVLTVAIAVLAFFSPVAPWVREVITWMLIPLPAIFGSLSLYNIHARRRADERLAK